MNLTAQAKEMDFINLHYQRLKCGQRKRTVRAYLSVLGAESARWLHQAHAVWKRKIISAQLTNDADTAAMLNTAWAFLKRNMVRKCSADGCEVSTKSRLCMMHSNAIKRLPRHVKARHVAELPLLVILWSLNSQGATVSPKHKETFPQTLSILRVPQPPEAAVQRAVTNVVTLGWTDTNRLGTRFRVAYGPNKNAMTNSVNAGTATSLTITNNPFAPQRYGVRAVQEDKESAFSALVKYPPDIVRDVFMESSTSPFGPWQREAKPIKSFTNTPAIPMQVLRLKIEVRKSYLP